MNKPIFIFRMQPELWEDTDPDFIGDIPSNIFYVEAEESKILDVVRSVKAKFLSLIEADLYVDGDDESDNISDLKDELYTPDDTYGFSLYFNSFIFISESGKVFEYTRKRVDDITWVKEEVTEHKLKI